MSIYDHPVKYSYLTPSVARMAYEQIVAWYLKKKLKDGADCSIPETISADHWEHMASTLKSAGINPELLEQAGLATIERETVHNCGMTNYSRDEYTYTVNMRDLYEFAQQPLQPPGASPTAAKNGKTAAPSRFKL